MKRFIEPGSGITMYTDQWYVLSDSGSVFTDTGFDSPLEAMFWLGQNARDWDIEFTDIGVIKQTGTLDMGNPCNIVKGQTLLKFWKEDNPETLKEMN
jgi:hypothetical protein